MFCVKFHVHFMYRRKSDTKLFFEFCFWHSLHITYTLDMLDNSPFSKQAYNCPTVVTLVRFLYYDRNAMITFLCLGNANLKSSDVIPWMPSPALPDINKHCCLATAVGTNLWYGTYPFRCLITSLCLRELSFSRTRNFIFMFVTPGPNT